MKNLFAWIIVLFCISLFIWGAYWLAKHGSYYLWYEDLVKETIREMVKPEYLK